MQVWVTGGSLWIAEIERTGSHPVTHEDIVYDRRVLLNEYAAKVNNVAEAAGFSASLARPTTSG
jgi:hypothetical protein